MLPALGNVYVALKRLIFYDLCFKKTEIILLYFKEGVPIEISCIRRL